MRALAVLVAAGGSTRMRGAGGARKPLVELAGRPILELACGALSAAEGIEDVVLVVHTDDVEEVRGWCRERPAFARVRAVLAGGDERSDSVRIGATAPLAEESELVAVHDAARPLVSPAAVERVLAAAARDGAALLALPVGDTLKRSEDGRHVEGTVDRKHLWAAQTPQVFEARRFREALERAARDGFRPTDDSALWERYHGPVTIVPGEPSNLKITRPEDLEIARALLAREEETR